MEELNNFELLKLYLNWYIEKMSRLNRLENRHYFVDFETWKRKLRKRTKVVSIKYRLSVHETGYHYGAGVHYSGGKYIEPKMRSAVGTVDFYEMDGIVIWEGKLNVRK